MAKLITFVTAANSSYKQYCSSLLICLEKLGYKTLIYDLGNLGQGIPFKCSLSTKSYKTIPAKPLIIYSALEQVPKGSYLVWLDADVLIRQRIDEIATNDYDLGVTVRKKREKNNKKGTINAGVIVVRHTTFVLEFLDIWAKLSQKREGDQWALNELCSFPINKTNQTIIKEKLVIKGFPCSVYNNFYFKKNQDIAKIIHFKDVCRKYYPSNLDEFLS